MEGKTTAALSRSRGGAHRSTNLLGRSSMKISEGDEHILRPHRRRSGEFLRIAQAPQSGSRSVDGQGTVRSFEAVGRPWVRAFWYWGLEHHVDRPPCTARPSLPAAAMLVVRANTATGGGDLREHRRRGALSQY